MAKRWPNFSVDGGCGFACFQFGVAIPDKSLRIPKSSLEFESVPISVRPLSQTMRLSRFSAAGVGGTVESRYNKAYLKYT